MVFKRVLSFLIDKRANNSKKTLITALKCVFISFLAHTLKKNTQNWPLP